ncbi:hypothetical protein [Luteolibacter marinus]|uniref:hypothetical protein n=1 Tax=Luteolibacter marinus TaxID=2776705 RepID=UPI00186780FF|nr:hypothetical protein [Luteolibacter marinus]
MKRTLENPKKECFASILESFNFKMNERSYSPTERIDMKTSLLPLVGIFPALSILPVHGQAAGVPVLSTPGTATWSDEVTSTGVRTTFTITGDTVLDWGQFNLTSGSELVFDFVGGESVVNMLGGTSTNWISGSVTSNGNVAFFSPSAPIRVTGTGSVTAANVTIATMDVNPVEFLSGDFQMNSISGAALSVSGTVEATDGSVLLAGQAVRVNGTGKIQAADAIRVAGGRQVNVTSTGKGRRLTEKSGSGFVLHQGEMGASRIEIAAGQEIKIGGELDTGSNRNRIFLEVGDNGQIVREGAGLLVGVSSMEGDYDPMGIDDVGTGEMDTATAVTTSALKIPALKRPDGSSASRSRTMVNNVSMSASADTGRDRKRTSDRQVASSGKPMLRRSSFFGMRGGSQQAKR